MCLLVKFVVEGMFCENKQLSVKLLHSNTNLLHVVASLCLVYRNIGHNSRH